MADSGIDFDNANRFFGRVVEVSSRGADIEVRIDCDGRELVSVLPKWVVESMDVKVGESIVALVNREDVSLLKEMPS